MWQHSCEWSCWHKEFVFERPSSETQSISVAMERWSVQHRAFAVETYLKNNDSVILTQRIFHQHLIFIGTTVSLVAILYCCGEKLQRNSICHKKENLQEE